MSVSIHFVNLADRYAIDGHLLGRSFSFHYDSAVITITIPSVIQKDRFLELGIPGIMDDYGIDEDNWGKINGYSCLDKPESIDAWLSTVLVKCSERELHNNVSMRIPQIAKKVVYAL